MHLKTLTLRGFKSFASATTLNLEPGITCVVGPNGSGKSNVVDALAWVMGEQGAKSMRGGKMEDVIFAGTSGRSPLGRAEVTLTIDNTDGALPIDYAEVTISRTLFRNGGSEYAINGTSCRLLDIQDLLSDSGLGREMHVIVGQGRLDAILQASPEERRGFIEEAAGVLKHRKRKEKALRKLDAMQANLTRVTDLTSEIRRQLGPLGKQAEVARKAQTVQSDLRDARARLLADDMVQLIASLEQELADETALRERRSDVEQRLEAARARLGEIERIAAAAAPQLAEASEAWYRLSSLRERLRGTSTLAGERQRLLGSVTSGPASSERDPDELQDQAARIRESERELADEVADSREALEDAVDARVSAEESLGAEEKRLSNLQRVAADRREGLARISGQISARSSRIEAAESELARLRAAVDDSEKRGIAAEQEFALLQLEVAGVEEGEEDLDAQHEEATAALDQAVDRLTALRDELAAAEREASTWSARRDGLELGMARKDGTGALLAASERLSGLLGSVAALLSIEPGYENAVAAALGNAADAVAVDSVGTAVDAIRYLRDEDAGRAHIVIAGGLGSGLRPGTVLTTSLDADGARWARELVSGPESMGCALDRLLAATVVVEDLAAARKITANDPELIAVTRSGEVISQLTSTGGSASAPSVLALQAALDEAAAKLSEASKQREAAAVALPGAVVAEAEARDRVSAVLQKLHDSDAQFAAAAEHLAQLGSVARTATSEVERLRASLEEAEATLESERDELAELRERLDEAEDAPEDTDPSTLERDRLAEAATMARQREMEARLTLRTGEERMRALSGRAEALEKAAEAERIARERAAERELVRERQAVVARAVRAGAEYALSAIEHSLHGAALEREAAEAERSRREGEVSRVRSELDALTAELGALTDVVHKDEVARAQQRLRIEQLESRAVDELGMEPAVLIEEFGPHQGVPQEGFDGLAADPIPYVREEQEKRLKKAERALSLLGRVNPLALEEFAALEERHKFLTDQLADLKRSRTDLLEIVREVDERVEQVFTEAWHDTAAQFEKVFATLFPGGEGKLILTDPDNMLTTGIEVEARPAGKKVKRLSLLSGGERSLAAVAILVAIFKARPSPFYVMDEVEAALDDVNLGRLLTIFEELRESSQLIVVTHQKRTMEIADALYGVTMRGDGVTTVISQRLRAED